MSLKAGELVDQLFEILKKGNNEKVLVLITPYSKKHYLGNGKFELTSEVDRKQYTVDFVDDSLEYTCLDISTPTVDRTVLYTED